MNISSIMIKSINVFNQKSAKLTKKSVVIDGYNSHFYENSKRGMKETIVLVHGLADDKNSFVQSAKQLTNDFHLVLIDLAGHGENERKDSEMYSIENQALFLKKLLSKIGVNSFHIAGNSMGGHIALSFTLSYPDDVKSLILVNAPGIVIDGHVVYGGFGDLIQSKDELVTVMSGIYYKVPNIPSFMANHMIRQINKDHDFVNNTVIPQIIRSADFDLLNRIDSIDKPVLILWGKFDEVVKFNVAQAYNQHIKDSKLVVIDNSSHSPQLEVPKEVGKEIQSFIEEII